MHNLSRQPVDAWRLMLVGALALVSSSGAVGQSAAPASGYDSTWYVSDFWSGEYPPGFSVTRPDTVVRARRVIDKAAPRDVGCKLPYLAVIHPWNQRRAAASQIKFLSATRIVRLIAEEPFVFEDVGGRCQAQVRDQEGRHDRVHPQ